ncbi:MAG: DEAD/DEAH box helicase, partial [Dehalococcoidia bacterium]
ELGVAADLIAALDKRGITSPFPVQTLTIPDALAGRDVCGKAKTGSGKTLAFGLPMLQRTTTARKRRPHALVLVPTRELANQVATELGPLAAARKLWLCAIYGGASMVRQIRALHAGVDIVIATPGRLNDLLERNELSLADVETVVVDEADQMADMGFLPQVRAILDRIEAPHQTLLFSATLDETVSTLVRRYQVDPVRYEVPSDTTSVETVEQRFIGVERPDKLRVAARICGSARRSLVFVRTKHGADRLAHQLTNQGVPAEAIHGGLNQNRRERTLANFMSGRAPVLVATNVAARGLHVDDIDIVLHFDLPEDGKTYLHRSGRTARAGAGGLVVTLVGSDEQQDARALQREAGINLSTTAMRPDDARLDDLGSWQPPAAAAQPEQRQADRRPQPSTRRPAAARHSRYFQRSR